MKYNYLLIALCLFVSGRATTQNSNELDLLLKQENKLKLKIESLQNELKETQILIAKVKRAETSQGSVSKGIEGVPTENKNMITVMYANYDDRSIIGSVRPNADVSVLRQSKSKFEIRYEELTGWVDKGSINRTAKLIDVPTFGDHPLEKIRAERAEKEKRDYAAELIAKNEKVIAKNEGKAKLAVLQGITFGQSSKQDVIELMGDPILKSNESLVYKKNMAGIDSYFVVTLRSGIAQEVGIGPSDEYLTASDNYDIYKRWDSALSKKYSLLTDGTRWSTGAKDLFGDSPELALGVDMVSFEKTYQGTGNLLIVIQCKSTNMEVSTTVGYVDKSSINKNVDDGF